MKLVSPSQIITSDSDWPGAGGKCIYDTPGVYKWMSCRLDVAGEVGVSKMSGQLVKSSGVCRTNE